MTDQKDEKRENWAEMSDEQDGADEQAAVEVKKPVIPKGTKNQTVKKGVKNDRGDYIITKIEIPDNRIHKENEEKEGQEVEESSSDEGYGDEEEQTQQEVVEVETD